MSIDWEYILDSDGDDIIDDYDSFVYDMGELAFGYYDEDDE